MTVILVAKIGDKEIKRKLRAFYDERHKFAHGHSPLVHPLGMQNVQIYRLLTDCNIIER